MSSSKIDVHKKQHFKTRAQPDQSLDLLASSSVLPSIASCLSDALPFYTSNLSSHISTQRVISIYRPMYSVSGRHCSPLSMFQLTILITRAFDAVAPAIDGTTRMILTRHVIQCPIDNPCPENLGINLMAGSFYYRCCVAKTARKSTLWHS